MVVVVLLLKSCAISVVHIVLKNSVARVDIIGDCKTPLATGVRGPTVIVTNYQTF